MFVIAFQKLRIISVLISSLFAFFSLSLLIIFKCVLNVSALAAVICAHVFNFIMNVTAFMIVLIFFFIVFMQSVIVVLLFDLTSRVFLIFLCVSLNSKSII